MKTHPRYLEMVNIFLSAAFFLVFLSCGGGDSNTSLSDSDATGATLQGNVISISNASLQVAAAVENGDSIAGIEVSIGELTVLTDEQGEFYVEDVPIGDQVIRFNDMADYLAKNIKRSETLTLRNMQIDGEEIVTEHTGTWTGTGGSTDSNSQGAIELTMIIEKNGNPITGTIIGGEPDNSLWEIDGTEDGSTIDAVFTLVRSESTCATGGNFEGTFSGNTLSGTFDEVFSESDPLPPECTENNENPEHGTFSLEKQP